MTTPVQPPRTPADPTLTDALAVDPWPHAPIHGVAPVPTASVAVEPAIHVVYVERPRRRRWPWVVGVLVGVLGLCGGIGLAATASIRAQYPATVTIPESVAGFMVVHNADYDKQTAELERKIRQEQNVDDAYARVLVDPNAAMRPVFLFGATKFILDPAGDLTKATRDLTNATQVQAYAPGRLGGKLRCGRFTGDDGTQAVACAWMDHGSIGIAVCPGGRSMDNCADTLTRIREAILHRP